MRHILLLASSIAVFALHGCAGCHSEVQVEAASTPSATVSVAVTTPPPPPEPVAVRNAQIEGTRIKIPHELEFAVTWRWSYIPVEMQPTTNISTRTLVLVR